MHFRHFFPFKIKATSSMSVLIWNISPSQQTIDTLQPSFLVRNWRNADIFRQMNEIKIPEPVGSRPGSLLLLPLQPHHSSS